MAYSLTYLLSERVTVNRGSLNAEKSGVSEIKALTLRERIESHLRLCETLDTSMLKLFSAYSGEDLSLIHISEPTRPY